MPPNTPGEGGERSEILQQLPPDIAEKLQKLGIQMDSETFGRIQSAGQEENLRKDISIALLNPEEKGRIEQLYLRGFGQVVQLADGKMVSVQDIANMSAGKEKDALINGLDRASKAKIKEYELQAANQRISEKQGIEQAANQTEKKIDTNIQAANQRIDNKKDVLNQATEKRSEINQERSQLNEMLGALIKRVKDVMDDTGRSRLDTLKQAELAKMESAPESSPIMQMLTQKGATREDIQSGKYASVIEAYIITTHATELTPTDPDKARQFQSEISRLGELFGVRATTGNAEALMSTKVLGPNRDRISDAVNQSIQTGQYETLRWDNSNREIILEDNRGNQHIIETARIPPRESIEKNGLRISREIAPIAPEEREKQAKESLYKNALQGTHDAEKNYATITGSEGYRQSYEALAKENSMKQLIQDKDALTRTYASESDPQKKQDTLTSILQKLDALDSERKNDGELLSNSGIERTLEMERLTLHDIQRRLTLQLQAQKDIPKGIKKEDDTFVKNAEYNIGFLSYIGYDTLGQDGLDRVIAELNRSANPRRGEIGEINLNEKLDTPKTQALTLAIANLARSGRQEKKEVGAPENPEKQKMETSQSSWDQVSKDDPAIAARQTQSLGFRDALLGVRRNLLNEGGSLKTDASLQSALYGNTVGEKSEIQ